MTATDLNAWERLSTAEKLDAWADQRQPWDKDAVTNATALLRQGATEIRAAEAERDELERLRKPLIVALAAAEAEIQKMLHDKDEDVQRIVDRAEAAEAEVARLREALTEYAGRTNDYAVARAALAAPTKCDCGHVHDRDSGCGDCSCDLWTCAALAKEGAP